ncbi:MAG: MBL fold metallo-hydrolase [Oligoflexia bacterium]|nr:MBL fold metallo-hydrolase [Oligoflexia bacterium]
MLLHLLGTGEAFDDEAGNNSCVLHGAGIPTTLFDCGYQIPERLWRKPRIYRSLEAVCLTHLHADHVFGLVPLLMRFHEEGRREELRVLGPRASAGFVRRLLEMGYPGFCSKLSFPLTFEEVAEDRGARLGPLKLRFARSTHSVLNLAVRVDFPRGRSLGISGDGQMTQATQALFADVGLLLQETYFPSPQGRIHCDLGTLTQFAAHSTVKRIGVVHTSRIHRAKIRALVEKLARRDPRWFMPEPGTTLRI